MPAAAQFTSAGELNAFIRDLNAGGGIDGELLPLVSESARFNDSFNSLDLRLSRPFHVRPDADRSAGRAVQRVQRDQHPWDHAR